MTQKSGLAGQFMTEFNMRHEPRDHNDVYRSIPHHLISEVDVPAEGVARLWQDELGH